MKPPGARVLAIVVIVLVVFAAYSVYGKDTVTVQVNGLGDVTGEMTIHFTDGSSTKVTKVKAGSTFVQYDGKEVSKLTITCSVNPKPEYGDKVRILCDSSDEPHMSKMVIKAGASTMNEIATFPLALTEQGSYKSITTGEQTILWQEIKTTRAEMIDCDWGIGTFRVVWQVHLWWNVDIDSREVHGARVDFGLPFQVNTITNDTPGPDDKDDKSDPDYGKLDPNQPFKRGSYSILTAETDVTKLGTATVNQNVATWTLKGL